MDSNLNLNATAWKAERTIEKASPYLINATFFNISVDLACPLGEFNEEDEKWKLLIKWDEQAAIDSGKPIT